VNIGEYLPRRSFSMITRVNISGTEKRHISRYGAGICKLVYHRLYPACHIRGGSRKFRKRGPGQFRQMAPGWLSWLSIGLREVVVRFPAGPTLRVLK
jgi:hypothetical protein